MNSVAYLKRQGHIFAPLLDGDEVHFRLTYDGPLLKAASFGNMRRDEKHKIRRAFHVQLANLWDRKDILRDQMKKFETEQFGEHSIQVMSVLKEAEKKYKRGKYTCFPIIRSDLHLVCYLDILFLRPEEPGALVESGGDLDNRIKTLFDALRLPQDDNEAQGYEPEMFEKPLFLCLLEDDKLITGFRITTDRLLEPATKPTIPEDDTIEPQEAISEIHFWEDHPANYVRLVVNVEIMATKLTQENMGYFSHF
jgi:hypothetical protein